MKKGFKPDLGLYLKENLGNPVAMSFLGIEFTEIMRIAPERYTIFTTYVFEETEYALTLDFSVWQLNELFDLMKPHFEENNFKSLVLKLLSFTEVVTSTNWSMPIPGICCQATLGEVEVNANEKYIPFIVQKFF